MTQAALDFDCQCSGAAAHIQYLLSWLYTSQFDGPPPELAPLATEREGVVEPTRLLCGEGVGRFQKLVKEYVAEVASAKVHELAPTNQRFAFPPAMHVQFFAGAVLSLLAWWLENDMPLSPHRMAQYLLSFHNTVPSHS
ncbi:MAG TPA: TetR-like C-terminal domain-containing protein [Ktedonobacteraceae bacterium]